MPQLLTNPADDSEFQGFARSILRSQTRLEEYQAALQQRYPSAAVHERILSDEPWLVWYVYRDGHWVAGAGHRDDGFEPADPHNSRDPGS